ncbi:MAG TPA: biotin carboxylase N-terminal domain-containing protein [Micromonosporaceae bacterium]|nr:biotin carboxylase N-terminal domain-containing protein [Micromonosporaceae bacterium]
MIRRLLVANRGEIARRVFATCRAMGVETVAVHSDADAGAPFVAEADRAVRLPGSAPADTYLRGDLIVAAARAAGADAIHPGYGFLAENARFAALVVDAGLTWVGPPAKAVALMGSKLEAKALLADAGVPMLPTWPDPAAASQFPVLVKASAGGGGRGMRLVRDAAALAGAVASARREATAAFGDGTVFAERYVDAARHIEVQVLADAHGGVTTFGERECSIQRRHQKIIEETPSPAVPAELREALCGAAVAAAQAVGYVGAGTVEFVLAPSGEFYFLEMNTRLQVEHPVTECVSGVDLVRMQLLVAEGAPLPFDGAPPLRGHAIEVRLCAEDPASDWRPATGTLHRFLVPDVAAEFRPLPAPGLRLDSGVADGSTVGVHYDSMLAKLVAWAPTRPEAARLLAGALARAQLHGVVTNRDLLVRVLRHPAFLAGDTDTGFLDRHPEVFAPLLSTPESVNLSLLAAALAGAAQRRASAPVQGGLPSGWRNVPSAPQTAVFQATGLQGLLEGPVEVGYRMDRTGALTGWSVREVDGDPAMREVDGDPAVRLVSATPERVVLGTGGVQLGFSVHRVGDVSYVDSPEGSAALTELPRFQPPAPDLAEGSLVAPLPGAVGRVLVAPGQPVAAGELLLTLEAMKLEHPVYAPAAGVVASVAVSPGTQVDTGAVLAVLTTDRPA